MTIGERIKRIRTFRSMTQAELGEALSFESKNQAVRIAQYESNYRVPKEDMVLQIAKILNCNYKALSNYDFGAAEDIIETFFWLEEAGNANTIKLFDMEPVQKDEDVKMTYNDNEYLSIGSPVAITFEYGLVNEFLQEWNTKKHELKDKLITVDEYFEWKIQWPQ